MQSGRSADRCEQQSLRIQISGRQHDLRRPNHSVRAPTKITKVDRVAARCTPFDPPDLAHVADYRAVCHRRRQIDEIDRRLRAAFRAEERVSVEGTHRTLQAIRSRHRAARFVGRFRQQHRDVRLHVGRRTTPSRRRRQLRPHRIAQPMVLGQAHRAEIGHHSFVVPLDLAVQRGSDAAPLQKFGSCGGASARVPDVAAATDAGGHREAQAAIDAAPRRGRSC